MEMGGMLRLGECWMVCAGMFVLTASKAVCPCRG